MCVLQSQQEPSPVFWLLSLALITYLSLPIPLLIISHTNRQHQSIERAINRALDSRFCVLGLALNRFQGLEKGVDVGDLEGGEEDGVVFMDWLCCFRSSCCELVGQSSSDSGKGKSRHSQTKVVYGFSLVKGKANHPMEDYHVAKFVHMKGQELGLFAIFDGHLGDNVPLYLQKNLFYNILKEEEFWTNPGTAFTKAYEKTDNAILTHSPDLGRGGSTAVTAILINGSRLWIANVGDSRAVFARGGQAIQMTVDHEPNTERGSIETRGGFVSNMPGDVPRVNGQLAVSRAFGDKSLKLHLRSDPDVNSEDINSDAELLILASDGLWKVMSNQEAVDLARKTADPQAAANHLISEALERDSKDDISCIVVRFHA